MVLSGNSTVLMATSDAGMSIDQVVTGTELLHTRSNDLNATPTTLVEVRNVDMHVYTVGHDDTVVSSYLWMEHSFLFEVDVNRMTPFLGVSGTYFVEYNISIFAEYVDLKRPPRPTFRFDAGIALVDVVYQTVQATILTQYPFNIWLSGMLRITHKVAVAKIKGSIVMDLYYTYNPNYWAHKFDINMRIMGTQALTAVRIGQQHPPFDSAQVDLSCNNHMPPDTRGEVVSGAQDAGWEIV